jgi:hypothetical protein
LRIRRNSSISVFNSLFIGYKRGLRLEGSGTQAKATGDTLNLKITSLLVLLNNITNLLSIVCIF